MSAKGDLIYVQASDPVIKKNGESGGAVTALLKFALEEGIVDAVLAVWRPRVPFMRAHFYSLSFSGSISGAQKR